MISIISKIALFICCAFILLGCIVNREDIWNDYKRERYKLMIVTWWVMMVCSCISLITIWIL